MSVVNFMAQAAEPISDSFEAASRSGEPQGSMLGVVIYLVIYALTSYLLGRIFAKAGEKPWKAWVPLYNTWILFKIGGYSPWMVLIPFVNIIVYIAAHYKIGKSLGKSGWFLLLALFLYPVWLAWLALDGSTWESGNGNPTQAQPGVPDQNQSAVTQQL